jgi:hypothetical protein
MPSLPSRRLHGWRTGCCLGVCRPRSRLDAHLCRAGTRRWGVLCRTLRRSLVGGHFSAAVRGLGACTCRGRTRWYCVRGWHALCDMLRCCCSSAYQLTGLAWLGTRCCVAHISPDRACVHALLAFVSHSFLGYITVLVVTSRIFSPACPHPTAGAASRLELLHLAEHEIRPPDAACTMCY